LRLEGREKLRGVRIEDEECRKAERDAANYRLPLSRRERAGVRVLG
jgi:hypothetical protein